MLADVATLRIRLWLAHSFLGPLRSPLALIDQVRDPLQRELIALRTAAGDHAGRTERHVRMVPELLPLMHVRDMYLDYRRLERVQRVQEGDRGVRECRRIDHDPAGGLPPFVDPVDQLVLAVALVEAQLELQL